MEGTAPALWLVAALLGILFAWLAGDCDPARGRRARSEPAPGWFELPPLPPVDAGPDAAPR